jgi:hypothetical protein
MKTHDRGRKVKGTRLAREMATLANLQLHDTHRIYTTMCFMNWCVHQNVLNVCTGVMQTDISYCVIVFVEQLKLSPAVISQWRFRVYKHLKDLNSDRPQTEDAKALRWQKTVSVRCSNTDMSRREQRFIKMMNSVLDILWIEFFTCIEKIIERTDWTRGYPNLFRMFCWERSYKAP